MQREAKAKEVGVPTLGGVVIGVVLDIKDGSPLVVFPGNHSDEAVPARTLVALDKTAIGSEVALSFETGRADFPVVLGKLLRPTTDLAQVTLDNTPPHPLDLTAQNELTLRCGKASITLTKEGKIILRGTYISSRSSGANRIKGGSVHLN